MPGSGQPSAQVEWERKFELGEGGTVPDLAGTGPVARQAEPVSQQLDATYFDTRDLRLARAGITLRRRTGGDDAGWHLKLPVGAERREEITVPLGQATYLVPAELAELVIARTRGDHLVPVAHIATTRRASELLDVDDRPIATLTDDHVTAEAIGPSARLDAWREVEVEIGLAGDEKALDAITEALEAAGIRRASTGSKLRRILGERLREAAEPEPGRKATAGEVVVRYLAAQVEHLRAHDPGVRRDTEDAVHQLRVATRRLRSALSSFRRVLDRSRTRSLVDELKWLAGELALARDTEVLRDGLERRVAGQPAEVVLGPVPGTLRDHFDRLAADGRAVALRALNSDRYTALLCELDDLVADPPFTVRAARPATIELREAIRRARRRLDQAVADLDDAPDRDIALHEVRKRAKQARYAADVVRPAFGKRLRVWGKKVKALQSTLGEHHDAVVARDALRELAVRADQARHSSFTYGLLHRDSTAIAEREEQAFAVRWAELARARGPRWL
jgi:CHAD domain-containing protein